MTQQPGLEKHVGFHIKVALTFQTNFFSPSSSFVRTSSTEQSGARLKGATLAKMAKANSGCLFLDMLPAEMRNNIYELVYANDTSEDNEIDLLTAEPPCNALILACRQIHDEAAKIYKSSYRDFWSQSSFGLYYPPLNNDYERCLQSHRSEDLQHITQFKISTKVGVPGTSASTPTSLYHFKLVRPNVWCAYTKIGGKKRIDRYWYRNGTLHGHPAWASSQGEQDLPSLHEAASLSEEIDLVSQIGYFIK